jgi:hypothetical protein
VSLYQILPRKTGGRLGKAEFPLRLLDIRRIDLNANGWETFYVKRAVEDWLREPQLNLGESTHTRAAAAAATRPIRIAPAHTC